MAKHKIVMYVDKIHTAESKEGKELTDAHEIADYICRCTRHLGSISFYVYLANKRWQKVKSIVKGFQ